MTRGWALAAAVVALGVAGPLAAQEAGIAVGAKAPPVVVHDLDGKRVDLGQVIGRRPVMLEFWATWCERCAALLPRVRAARDELGERVAFYGVNVTVNQTRDRVRRYVETERPPFVTLYDDDGTSVRAYRAPSTSYIVIVDRAGKVAYTGLGEDQDFLSALRKVAAP